MREIQRLSQVAYKINAIQISVKLIFVHCYKLNYLQNSMFFFGTISVLVISGYNLMQSHGKTSISLILFERRRYLLELNKEEKK